MQDSKIKVLLKALGASIKIRDSLSLFVCIAGFGMAFVPSVMAVVLRNLTDKMQLLMSRHITPGLAIRDFTILIILFVLQLVFSTLKNYTQHVDVHITILKYIRKKTLMNKCEVKYKYIENHDQFYDRVTFVETQAGMQVANSFQNMVNILHHIITFVSIIVLLINVDIKIVLVLLVTSIPAAVLSYLQKDELYYQQSKWMKENALVLHYYYICSGEHNIYEVRHFGLFSYLKNRWREFADTFIDKKKKLTLKHVAFNSGADFLRSAVYIAILLFTAYKIYRNPAIGLGTFTLVYTLSGKMQEVSASLLTGIMQLFGDIPYMRDFFYLDTLEKDQGDIGAPMLAPGDISFQKVTFRYPNTDKDALADIDVTIKEGEKVAIVGENGSGKTTFVSLLCGMFEPVSGSIKIGDADINEHIAEARNSISVVFQDFGHYEDTLRSNITISDKRRISTDDEILELARKTNTLDVIEALPSGLDEQIGTFNKKARDLSGGQWQKISITRAAYRKNANIMILDEPTAALDPIAEAQLYKNFSDLTDNKTTILISHRLGITSLVDRILVFKDGKIIEDGSHRELMERDGYYKRMYQAQAQWYQA